MVQISAQQGRSSLRKGQIDYKPWGQAVWRRMKRHEHARGDGKLACKPRASRSGQSFSRVQEIYALVHRKKKDGGCTFYHNTLRTKLSPLRIWKDMV